MAAAAGCLLATAGPPTSFYPGLWLGMAGLAYVGETTVESPRSRRSALWVGLVFGIAANLVALRFVPGVVARFTTGGMSGGWAALSFLSVAQGLRWGAAAVVQVALRRRGVPLALAFGTGVFAGTFVPTVFPWSPAGGVTPVVELVQLAEWAGERGVTFVMALSAGFVAQAATELAAAEKKKGYRSLLVAAAIPAVTFLVGRVRLGQVAATRRAASSLRVALLQPGISTSERWNRDLSTRVLARLTAATAGAEHDGAELTVWPEAAYPFVVGHASRRCPIGPLSILPYGVRGPVLTGMVMSGGEGDLWNSAAVCRADGTLSAPQDKIHLLWFGETIPWLDRLPWIRSKFTRGIGLIAGKEAVLQQAGRARAAVLNCFEDTLPDAGREAMALRPNLLVNITNDGWFAGSEESELHLRLAALRAVESRRDLVRAVNLGAASWIDATGVVRARADGSTPGVVMADAALLETQRTLFDQLGDAPLAFVLLVSSFVATRRKLATPG